MQNLTIGKRIAFGFAAVLVLVAILATAAVLSLRTIHKTLPMITEDSMPGMAIMSDIESLAGENKANLLRHLMATTPEEKKSLEARIIQDTQAINKLFADYEKTIHLDVDRQNFKKLEETRDRYRSARAALLDLSRASKTQEAKDYFAATLVPAFDIFKVTLDTVSKWNADYGNTGAACIEQTISRCNWVISVLSVAAGVLGIACACFIAISVGRVLSRVSGTLSEGANHVVEAAGQVSTSSQSLAEGSSEQAASIEETSSSLEEMAAMTRRNADNARNANDLAKQASDAADKGASDMQTMSAAMEAIKVSSNDISKIIKTIDEIAFQTNILALNAAVEAARAGEAGMGFAVVADEVRSLAQRSAAAARETADKIEGAITKTGQGVEINRKVAAALNDIVTKVRQVNELVTEVANASREQTEGITQINTAVGQMDKVTQSNAANAEESAAAAQELNAQAGVMRQSVGELLQLVGGIRESAARRPTANVRPLRNIRGAAPAAKPHAAVNASHNGHAPKAPALTTAQRRDTIPMEGDFTNF